MGQIVGGAAKPKRCNLNKLSQLGIPAAGEHILVSSDNSMNAAGQGNFDYYIVGDGTKAAYLLKLNRIVNNKILVAEKTGANIAGLGWTSVNRYYYGITNNGIIDYHTNNSYHVIWCVTSQLFKKGDIIHFERQATVARVTIFAFSHTNLSTGDIEGVQVDIASNVTSTEHNYDVVCPYDNAYLLIYVYYDTKWIADTMLFDFMQFADVTDCVLKVEQPLSLSEQKQARKNLGLGNGNIDDKPDLLSHNIVESSGIANAIDNIIGREANYVDGRYLLSTGSNAGDSAWMYSVDYIQASEGDVVIWHPAVVKSDAVILIYNSSKEVISFYTANAVERTLTMPANTAYIRASFAKENTSGIYLKINGLDAWKPFEAITPFILPVVDSLKAELSACVLKVEQSLSLSEQKQVRKNLGLGNGNVDDAPNLLSPNVVSSSGIAKAIDNIIGREANYVDGRYLLSTGSNAGDSAWMYSVDYIQASEGDVVIWHPAVVKSNAVILIYNSSKEVLSFYTANAVERTLTMPANTAYIRASFAKENTSGIYLKINGLDAWQPYDAVQPIMPIVENSLNSTSETNALSANMGRELERERILRLTGNNNNFVEVIYGGVILPEHRYKIHLLNKDFDVTGDTISTTHTRLEFKYKFADSSDPVMLYNMNSTAVLKDSYEFSIPEGINDVSFYIGGRATLGEVVKFVLEDITDRNTSDSTNTYIASKCSTFRGMFSAAGASTLSFLFFTDPHLMGTNGTFDAGKYKEWMGIIENYYHNIPTDFCLCGGDLLNSGDTPAQACDKLGYADGTSRKSLYPYKFVLGNHDTNYLGTEELPQDAIDAILFREEGKAYYRFDTDNCTCFVFDTGKDNDHSQSAYRIAQYGFFKDGLLSNVKDNIVLFFHIYYYNSTNQAVMAKDIMDMAGAFNNRTSVTIAGTIYDFSAVTHGTIRFAIVGHSHADFNVVDNGIPVIGTLNVQANGESPSFDMVLADFSNNVINLVRVGQGSDRTIQM